MVTEMVVKGMGMVMAMVTVVLGPATVVLRPETSAKTTWLQKVLEMEGRRMEGMVERSPMLTTITTIIWVMEETVATEAGEEVGMVTGTVLVVETVVVTGQLVMVRLVMVLLGMALVVTAMGVKKTQSAKTMTMNLR
jgi:hypothetical protein